MDFITWVFDKHYILSTLCFPGLSFFWSVFHGEVVRGAICALLCVMKGVARASK